jgi:hypothetical protein
MANFGDKFGEGTKFGAFKELIANAKITCSIEKAYMYFKTLTANVIASVNIPRSIAKTLTALAKVTPTIQRFISKTLTATATAASTIGRSIGKILTANVKATCSIQRLISKTLTALAEVTSTIQRLIAKTLTALASITSYIKRYFPVYPSLTCTTYDVELECTTYDVELEVKGLAITGSTVTLQGTFPSAAGDLAELETVVCKVYAPGHILLDTLDTAETETGVYIASFDIPDERYGQFDYEFSGTLGTKTIIGRDSFDSNWK